MGLVAQIGKVSDGNDENRRWNVDLEKHSTMRHRSGGPQTNVTPSAWMCFTSPGIPNCGSTSTSKGTWSGMISRAMTSARYLKAALGIKLKGRSATLSTSTLRRYFGHQTTWHLLLYATL